MPGDRAGWDVAAWLPGARVERVELRAGQVYAQLRDAVRRGVEVFVNLCDGPLAGEAPSIEVVWQLERLRVAFTGADSRLRGLCRTLMRYVAHVQGVATARWVVAASLAECERAVGLGFPLRVVSAQVGDEVGEEAGVVVDEVGLRRRCEALLGRCERVVIEVVGAGRGFCVVVAAGIEAGERPRVWPAVELGGRGGVVQDEGLAERLVEAARRMFVGFEGVGYARVELRLGEDGGVVCCDIEFGGRLFGDAGIDAALGGGRGEFWRHVIAEARARHARVMPRYSRRGDASVGFGIFADVAIAAGELVFAGEERGQRIVTRGHVEGRWSAAAKEDFQAYAYPLSDEVFILWDRDPGAWAPQNHSCDPNTRYCGLDVVASRDIAVGEELTFDYADCYNEAITPFACKCGAGNCRGWVAAPAGNSVTRREWARRGR